MVSKDVVYENRDDRIKRIKILEELDGDKVRIKKLYEEDSEDVWDVKKIEEGSWYRADSM